MMYLHPVEFISIPNPENTHEGPIFEGMVREVNLRPGVYNASHLDFEWSSGHDVWVASLVIVHTDGTVQARHLAEATS